MLSGPKKRRAAAKKINDTNTKTSTNPAEDQAGAAVEAVPEMVSVENKGKESQTVDQRTKEAPLMVNLSENMEKGDEDVPVMNSVASKSKVTETVIDQSVMESPLVDPNSKKSDVNEGGDALDVSNLLSLMVVKPVEPVFEENLAASTKEQDSSVDQNENAGQEKIMVLEQLLLISTEISCNAEKQLSFAVKLSQLLAELKGSKGI